MADGERILEAILPISEFSKVFCIIKPFVTHATKLMYLITACKSLQGLHRFGNHQIFIKSTTFTCNDLHPAKPSPWLSCGKVLSDSNRYQTCIALYFRKTRSLHSIAGDCVKSVLAEPNMH